MIHNETKKTISKIKLAKLFSSVSSSDVNSKLKNITSEILREKHKEEFDKYLELTTIWFQSILGLKVGPSNGNSDNKRMVNVSMKQFLNKVNEFHKFISQNTEYLPFLSDKIDLYSKCIMNNPEAVRIWEKFKNIAHKNLEKLNLIINDFDTFLFKLESNNNREKKQYYLKIQDSLLKLLILLHEPISDVFSRFE
jgi:hypothetical protein